MNDNDRMKILNKIEELTIRAGALAATASQIERELAQLQATFYQQTEGEQK